MGDYFHGWRRKIGMMTLVMACAITGLWLRSYLRVDELWVRDAGTMYCWDSIDGSLCWYKGNVPAEEFATGWESAASTPNSSELFANLWNWGFDSGAWKVPHWSLVAPLTLISAYLLLVKARKSSQTKPVEPIAEKVE